MTLCTPGRWLIEWSRYRTASHQDHPIESKVCGIDHTTLILFSGYEIGNIKYFVKVLEVYSRFLQIAPKVTEPDHFWLR